MTSDDTIETIDKRIVWKIMFSTISFILLQHNIFYFASTDIFISNKTDKTSHFPHSKKLSSTRNEAQVWFIIQKKYTQKLTASYTDRRLFYLRCLQSKQYRLYSVIFFIRLWLLIESFLVFLLSFIRDYVLPLLQRVCL